MANASRSDRRNFQCKSGDKILFWRSLQSCKLDDNMNILDEAIKRIIKPDLLGHLKGSKAILEILLSVPPSASGINRRTSCICFDRAYEIYLSYSTSSVPEQLLNDGHHKRSFKEFICGKNYGLCVYIYRDYVILRPDDVDLDFLFASLCDEEFNNDEDHEHRLDLITNFERILKTIDSEWDRKVLKVVIGTFCSRAQLADIGIRAHDIKNMTENVLHTITESESLVKSAEEEVQNNLDRLISELDTRNAKMKKRKIDMSMDWSELQLDELQDDIGDLTKRIEDLKQVRTPGESQKHCWRLNMMEKNTFKKLVKERRLKRRKRGGGRKEGMDDLDEQYLLRMIETKATAHGRRGDEVLYTNRRVKLRDMKKLVNKHRLGRGLAPVKSRITVYNRSRPKNKRSRQAKLHKGGGLFCAKKAPKAEDNENETTHYLRSFKRNVDRHHYSTNKGDAQYVLEVSSDDKAYLQPGTSTGFRGARNCKIYQPSNDKNARKLPKYDFPKHMVNVTPGTYRYLSKDFEEVEGGKPRKVLTLDSTYVFLRPKYFVGSSGDVWASEAMVLRYEIPHKYLLDPNNCIDKHYLAFNMMLKDSLLYYVDSTHPQDLEKISNIESCIHRKYELNRMDVVLRTLWKSFTFGDLITDANKVRFNEMKLELQELSDMLTKLKPVLSTSITPCEIAISRIKDVSSKCSTIAESIQTSLPEMKTRYLESTDAGPGVSIKQHDVQIRLMQRIRIQNLDYYMRYHLANGDSSFNEVERCQSYVGDALCDGQTIEWEHQKLIDPHMLQRLKNMTLEELQFAEEKRMLHNARMVCKAAAARIHGGIAPNGYMKAFTTLSTDDLFFNDKECLDIFFSKGVRERIDSPGGYYYAELLAFLETHCHVAEKYLEFVKSACNQTNGELCTFCSKHPWVGPKVDRVPAPYPDKTQLPGYHYCDVSNTPVAADREIDDYQPRIQLRKLVANKEISLDDPESIDSFCAKFIVDKTLVMAALEHLQLLQIRKEKKKQQELLAKNKVVKYEDIEWEILGENNKLHKLPVKTLNLYLEKHSLKDKDQLTMKKPEKCKYIRHHMVFKSFKDNIDVEKERAGEEAGDAVPNSDPETGGESDSEDEVLRVVDQEDSECDTDQDGDTVSDSFDSGSAEDDDPMDDDVGNIFHTTRSGRCAMTWRASGFC